MEVKSDSQHFFFSSRHDFGSTRHGDRKKHLIEPPCFELEDTYSGKQPIGNRTSGLYLKIAHCVTLEPSVSLLQSAVAMLGMKSIVDRNISLE